MTNGTMKDQFENPDENVKSEKKIKPSGIWSIWFFYCYPYKTSTLGKMVRKAIFVYQLIENYYTIFCNVQKNAIITEDIQHLKKGAQDEIPCQTKSAGNLHKGRP